MVTKIITLAELETGLCLETGITSWHDFVGDLKFLCGSLIRLDGPQEEVSFVHQTARDFLEAFSRNLSVAVVDGIVLNAHIAHEHLAETRVQYLNKEEISRGLDQLQGGFRTQTDYKDMESNFLGRHPFLRYAVESWAFHTRSISTPSSAFSTTIRSFLSSRIRRDDIMTFTYIIMKQVTWGIPYNQTPLHLAAYFNIPWLAQRYISINKSSVHAVTGVNDTPLIWASEMGSTECVTILLDAGADPNEFEVDGWSALHWAARNGHLDIATMLLEHGASLSQEDKGGHTPLDWAVDREHWDVAGVLERWSNGNELPGFYDTSRILALRRTTLRKYATRNIGQLWDYRP